MKIVAEMAIFRLLSHLKQFSPYWQDRNTLRTVKRSYILIAEISGLKFDRSILTGNKRPPSPGITPVDLQLCFHLTFYSPPLCTEKEAIRDFVLREEYSYFCVTVRRRLTFQTIIALL